MNLPPFPAAYHSSGLLLHVTSLPSPYGIGDLGPTAFSWVKPPSRCGPAMVAVAACRSDWIREFAVSVALVVCREHPSDQSRGPDSGRVREGKRMRPSISGRSRRL